MSVITQDEIVIGPETLEHETSRRAFLTKIMAGAAAATALAAAPSTVFGASGQFKFAHAAFPQSDADILNFALTLEHLEARFYTVAATRVGMRFGPYVNHLITTLKADELAHVSGLTAALKQGGYTPVAAAGRYNLPAIFGTKTSFLGFVATLENTGVGAYLGQAPLIKTPSILLTAASIVTVEARHTGAARALLQHVPTDGAFDKGISKPQVLAIAGPLIGK